MTHVTLFATPGSPYSRVAELALREKGVPHIVDVVPFGAHLEEPHLCRHPFAKVPVLAHGDFVLYETAAIIRYVDEAFAGPSLSPGDPRTRGRMAQAIGIVDSYLFPSACGVIAWQRLIVPKTGGVPDEAAIAAARPLAARATKVLDDLLGEAPWLSGPAFGLADLMAVPFLAYYWRTPEGAADMSSHDRLCRWLQTVEARPSLVATDPFAQAR